MAFVLHNDAFGNEAIWKWGRRPWRTGLRNGIAIQFDTYQNVSQGDIASPHTGIVATDPSARPIRLSSQVALSNLTDGQWHDVDVQWNAATRTLTYTFDGVQVGKLQLTSASICKLFRRLKLCLFWFYRLDRGIKARPPSPDSILSQQLLKPVRLLCTPHPHDGSIFDVTSINQHLTLNGSASSQNTHQTLTLTPDAQNQAGSAIFNDKIDLTHDFNIAFSVYFGPGQPADGLAFVLHNDPNGADALGNGGGGLGAMGLQNGLAIEFDTYQQRVAE